MKTPKLINTIELSTLPFLNPEIRVSASDSHADNVVCETALQLYQTGMPISTFEFWLYFGWSHSN